MPKNKKTLPKRARFDRRLKSKKGFENYLTEIK